MRDAKPIRPVTSVRERDLEACSGMGCDGTVGAEMAGLWRLTGLMR